MNFLWPISLSALALIPLVVLLFAWRQRRRQRYAARYSSLSLVRSALPAQSRLRRYLPMALFLFAIASLAISLARPVAITLVPAGRATVVLALDVSGSMTQRDIFPSRLAVAKKAALEFVNRQKDTNQVGIVAFAGIAQLVQPPTSDPEALETAIRNLTTGRGTAIGSGIVTGLETISEFGQNLAGSSSPGSGQPPIPDTGEHRKPDIIVLLTDGNSNRGIDPVIAAQQAQDSGVRVYTISYGTREGASGDFDRGGRSYGWNRGIDEDTLRTIAEMTGGEYFTATSASDLQKVFDSLPTLLVTREETFEISVVFALLAAFAVIAAVLLAQLWQPLP